MADSAGRSRGRARGRARSVDPNQGAGAPGGAWQQRPGAPARGPGPAPAGPSQPQGVWGPRPGGGPRPQPQQAPPAWGPRPAAPVPQPQTQAYAQRTPAPPAQAQTQAGRAVIRQGDVGTVQDPQRVVMGPGGDAGNSAGRGSVRGRRQIGADTHSLLTRPADRKSKQGTSGTPIRLSANYFELITQHKDWCLYQYRVDFAPDQDLTKVRKQLLGTACKDKLAGFLFDGSMLFTPRRIQPDPMELFVNPPGDTGEPVRITIRLVGNVANGDYHLLQFFNLIVRKCLSHMKLQMVGRNYYDARAKIQIPQYDIELWPGYVTSIRQHESKILLCCEIAHKFMRKENVLKVLMDAAHQDRANYKRNFTQQIVGCVVLTDYNNRTYRVDDVDWSVNPKSTFGKSDGTSISYVDYYKQRYQIKVSEGDQPMLVSRAKARELRAGMAEIIYLVPELCRMTGLTELERGNMSMMRALAEHTRLSPEGRTQRLEQYAHRMNNTAQIVEELNRWDMKLSGRLIEVGGRVMPAEVIVQGARGEVKTKVGQDADWTRSLRSNPMALLGTVKSWVVVCASSLKKDAYGFVQALQKCAAGMSLQLPAPKLQEISDDRPSNFLDGLEQAMNNFNPNIILCVASNNKADRYAAIKKKCCVDRAVPTQVILKKNILAKGMMSIATKVAIQMNCKLGGAPWTVEMPLSNLMVIGFDVCHDTMNKGKSYGGMVASLDRQVTRYFSSVTAHTNGEELSNDFALNILKAIKQYQEINNGNIPEKIIIYRDGVGDGQLPYVFSHEVKRIEEQLKQYYRDKPLKMAFIVVSKRINTRLFAGDKNPPPGTVVDDVVTLPQRYDFFIVSQCVRQGTVSPTSYNVIYDTLGLDPDKLQRLTYKFTHMYYNWSGTVRVPAPCQYAHKLAFLVSQALHRNPNPQLCNSLYFL